MSDAHSFRLDPGLLKVDPTAFVAPGAVVLGDVHLGAHASVWFGAVVRGDTEMIRIGARTNLQDGTIVHADPGCPCLVGDDVTVGHRVLLHGCRVGSGSLIGMSSTLMNGAVIGERCLIGAGTLITEGKQIPPGSLVMGSPGKVIRALTAAEQERMGEGVVHYVDAARAYRAAGLVTRT
jgi:carbonic anhydrase/acetyltransferase-like protein (isoleucine patch superfamily)